MAENRITRAPTIDSLREFQAAHSHWRGRNGILNESPGNIAAKLLQEVGELDMAIAGQYSPKAIALEAADVFLLSATFPTVANVPLDAVLSNGSEVKTFTQLHAATGLIIARQNLAAPVELIPGIHSELTNLVNALNQGNNQAILRSSRELIYAASAVILLSGLPIDKTIVAKHSRNEYKYNNVLIKLLIEQGRASDEQEAMAIIRREWDGKRDYDFLSTQLGED